MYGAKVVHELCPNGAQRALTNENRHEYVDRYVDYILNTSIEAQFAAFKYVLIA